MARNEPDWSRLRQELRLDTLFVIVPIQYHRIQFPHSLRHFDPFLTSTLTRLGILCITLSRVTVGSAWNDAHCLSKTKVRTKVEYRLKHFLRYDRAPDRLQSSMWAQNTLTSPRFLIGGCLLPIRLRSSFFYTYTCCLGPFFRLKLFIQRFADTAVSAKLVFVC